jgi:hypothetical protein
VTAGGSSLPGVRRLVDSTQGHDPARDFVLHHLTLVAVEILTTPATAGIAADRT